MTNDLLALSDWLRAEGCGPVVMESTGSYTLPTMLQSVGRAVCARWKCRRTDPEDDAKVLLIHLHSFDQGANNLAPFLKSLMSGWTAQRMKMGQTVGEPVAVVGTILVHQSPSEKLTEGTVQQR